MSNTLRNIMIKYGVDISQYDTAISKMRQQQQALESDFRDTANGMENWRSKSEGLAVRVSTLNEKVKLQRQVVDQLKQEYKEVSTATGEESAASQRLEKQYINASGTLDKMNRELNGYQEELYQAATAEGKTSKEAQEMGGKIKGASKETSGFKSEIKDFAKQAITQFASITGVVMLLKQALQKVWEMTDQAADFADELNTLANKTGIAGDKLQEYAYVARFADTEVETITSSMAKLSRNMYNASRDVKEQKDAFDELGVAYMDGNGNLRDNEDVFNDLIDALGGMTDETKRDALAMVLMGKSAQDLNPLIKTGSKEIKRLADEARNSGVIIDRIQVAALQRLDDKIERTSATVQSETRKMAASFAPAASAAVTLWQEIVKGLNNAIDVNKKAAVIGRNTLYWTKEQAASYEELSRTVTGAYNASGLSINDFKTKTEDLISLLQTQGLDADAAQTEALMLVAEGYDAATYSASLLETKQMELDAQLQSSVDAMNAKMEEYNNAVTTTTEKYLAQMGGLFDAVEARVDENGNKIKVSGDELAKNLQDQIGQFTQWSDNISRLSKKGVDQGLIDELRQMGPKALPEIQALNNMSETELNSYVELWRYKNQLAKEEAIDELKPMAAEVAKKINDTVNAVKSYSNDMMKAGRALAQGVASGINKDSYKIKAAALQAAKDALKAAKDYLGVHSPSKRAEKELGMPFGEGFEIGLSESMSDAFNTVKGSLSNGMSTLSNVNNVTNINNGSSDISALAKLINAPRSVSMLNTFSGTTDDQRKMLLQLERDLMRAVS